MKCIRPLKLKRIVEYRRTANSESGATFSEYIIPSAPYRPYVCHHWGRSGVIRVQRQREPWFRGLWPQKRPETRVQRTIYSKKNVTAAKLWLTLLLIFLIDCFNNICLQPFFKIITHFLYITFDILLYFFAVLPVYTYVLTVNEQYSEKFIT